MNASRYLRDGPENHGHRKCGDKSEEQEYEERTSFLSQLGHEIQRNVKAEDRDYLDRQFTDGGRDRFGKGVVQCIARLLFHNWSLCIKGKYL